MICFPFEKTFRVQKKVFSFNLAQFSSKNEKLRTSGTAPVIVLTNHSSESLQVLTTQ